MDENRYLANMLAYGAKVQLEESHSENQFMVLMVEYFNKNNERSYYAIGDIDGVVLHTSDDNPLMILTLKQDVLNFNLIDVGAVLENKSLSSAAGYMALNVVGFLINYHNYLSRQKPKFTMAPGIVDETFETTNEDDSFGIK